MWPKNSGPTFAAKFISKRSRTNTSVPGSGAGQRSRKRFGQYYSVRRWTALIHLFKAEAVHLLKIDNTTVAICPTTLYYGRKIALHGRRIARNFSTVSKIDKKLSRFVRSHSTVAAKLRCMGDELPAIFLQSHMWPKSVHRYSCSCSSVSQ